MRRIKKIRRIEHDNKLRQKKGVDSKRKFAFIVYESKSVVFSTPSIQLDDFWLVTIKDSEIIAGRINSGTFRCLTPSSAQINLFKLVSKIFKLFNTTTN